MKQIATPARAPRTTGGSSRRTKAAFPAFSVQREVKLATDSAPHGKPSLEDVRRRAYEIYLERMRAGEPGGPDTDWSRAERELAHI